MCRATLSGPAREFRAGPTAFLAGCSAVWASRAPPRDDLPGFSFLFSQIRCREGCLAAKGCYVGVVEDTTASQDGRRPI
jgi:hypothetical protein